MHGSGGPCPEAVGPAGLGTSLTWRSGLPDGALSRLLYLGQGGWGPGSTPLIPKTVLEWELVLLRVFSPGSYATRSSTYDN